MNSIIAYFEKLLNVFIERGNIKKIIYSVCFFFLVVMTLPIFFLSFYNFMCADDFVYSNVTHSIWENNKSFLGIIKIFFSALEMVKTTFLTWGGNYTSIFFSSIQPSAFNYKLTFINTFIFVGFFLISNFFFLMKICKSYFEIKPEIAFLFYSIIMFLSIDRKSVV